MLLALPAALGLCVAACGSKEGGGEPAASGDTRAIPPEPPPLPTPRAAGSAQPNQPSPAAKPEPAPASAGDPAPLQLGMTVDKERVLPGEPLDAKLTVALSPPAGQKYWIAMVPASEPDTTFGDWQYLPPGAMGARLTAGKAGEYEVRLHDLHPRYKGRVIARQRVTVLPASARESAKDRSPPGRSCASDQHCNPGWKCAQSVCQEGAKAAAQAPAKKACTCSQGKSYWGPCERTGCVANYTCSDRDRGGDGNCYCSCR